MAQETQKLCERCGRDATLQDLGLCVGCGLTLYRSLGDIVADLAYAPRLPRMDRPMGVLAAVQAKRRRTGTYRFIATRPSIKGVGV